MTPKVRIILKAIQIRLDRGEHLEDILDSYPALTEYEIFQIREVLKSEE